MIMYVFPFNNNRQRIKWFSLGLAASLTITCTCIIITIVVDCFVIFWKHCWKRCKLSFVRTLPEHFACRAGDLYRTHLFTHYKNTPIQIYWKFPTKNWKFSDKYSDIFHISAQNIDCGYSLEPLRRGGSNKCPHSVFWAEVRKMMFTLVNPSFTL